MPLDSVICRRNLDESRGNPFICECPLCRDERKETETYVMEGIDDRSDPPLRKLISNSLYCP
jgi:hypothetical protein